MENTTTRIADLPENITMQASNNGLPTNYTPMNIHPNPYGNNVQNPVMPMPQQTSAPNQSQNQQQYQLPPPQSQYLSEEQQLQLHTQQPHRLPSRDLVQDTTSYIQDDNIRANYVPRSNINSDYVKDSENATEKNAREYQQNKQHQNRLDQLLNEFQIPIVISILFFVFQMPLINTMIFKRFAFLSIYNDDGNYNFNGFVFKSIIFGAAYYLIMKATNYLTEI
jgi:hypothetical protein